MNLLEYARKYNLVATHQKLNKAPPGRADVSKEGTFYRDATHYLVWIENGTAHDFRCHWSQGSAVKGTPKLLDVLECLRSDFQTIILGNPSFESWAEDLGYDTDSRLAEGIYNEIRQQCDAFEKFLGRAALVEFVNTSEDEETKS